MSEIDWSVKLVAGNIDEYHRHPTTKKPQHLDEVGLSLELNPAASYSSIERLYSTIGAGGLNGRVRDGIGCDTSAIATGKRRSLKKAKPTPLQSFRSFRRTNQVRLHSRNFGHRVWRFLNNLKLCNVTYTDSIVQGSKF